ncbi:hypothetical protein BV898_07577 [Hypsibius exemplaris]|uniref:Homeobox domain-containing protein n=1 Tax=Hypsibius exemplaris TaxID=2072580 RepID=A0A1W0WT44_HYPEX|nr:hypothetical protein BV898_07577 [Hypsibius exemplaris]
MAKRGRKPKSTPEANQAQIAEIISLYEAGKTHAVISAEMNVPDSEVKQILSANGTRRSSRKFCGLTQQQDQELMQFVKSQEAYRGSYRVLRGIMEQFVLQHGIRCDFSHAWRRSFHTRHQDALPPVIRTLLGLRPDQDDTEVVTEGDDPDGRMEHEESAPEDSFSVSEVQQEVEETPTVVEEEIPDAQATVEVDSDVLAAVQMAMEMYAKAGVSEERARKLLEHMHVPGFPSQPRKKKRTSKTKKAMRLIKPVSDSITASLPVTVEMASPSSKCQPPKKTPLQLRVLEREFLKNAQMTPQRATELGDKLNLDGDQIISWFRNKRLKRPASAKK